MMEPGSRTIESGPNVGFRGLTSRVEMTKGEVLL